MFTFIKRNCDIKGSKYHVQRTTSWNSRRIPPTLVPLMKISKSKSLDQQTVLVESSTKIPRIQKFGEFLKGKDFLFYRVLIFQNKFIDQHELINLTIYFLRTHTNTHTHT